ncbi:hypothetical protein A1OE_1001 [Candidatus Endolissoclinum faulkneri L2]|uniref:Uncharacterized protein n=1 Tax=Candidatus Endolissoclinum faulkneri L2 TaxID=1193729 RepID=K7YNQ9_9PROT|nr:hypothetical protein A1OE_1001 [Candidatus Endolissoclinum faulkneri L2]
MNSVSKVSITTHKTDTVSFLNQPILFYNNKYLLNRIYL